MGSYSRTMLLATVLTLTSGPVLATGYTFQDLGAGATANAVSGGVAAGNVYVGGGVTPTLWGNGPKSLDAGPADRAVVYAACDGQYGGAGVIDRNPHAALYWPSESSTPLNLNPTGYWYSRILGMDATQQVGAASLADPLLSDHALLWSGTADSVVDLNPTDLPNAVSVAYDTWGGYQVGTVWSSASHSKAVLWHGSAASWRDLTPAGYRASEGRAVWNGYQVGVAWSGDVNDPVQHAMLWHGTAASGQDISPAGFHGLQATDIFNNVIVGFGFDEADGMSHALAWLDGGETVVDLHAITPSRFMATWAYGVDEHGHIVGVALERDTYVEHAVMWSPVPEPATLGLLGLGMAAAVHWRKGRQSTASGRRTCLPSTALR